MLPEKKWNTIFYANFYQKKYFTAFMEQQQAPIKGVVTVVSMILSEI